MNKRLFIAINLPENIKIKIAETTDNLQKSQLIKNIKDIRFIAPENWHLTLDFLGYQPEEKINDIINSIQQTILILSHKIAQKIEIKFDKIVFGPLNKQARMVWFTTVGKTSQVLEEIKNEIENNLIKNDIQFEKENREYRGHITLARFEPIKIQDYPIIELPLSFRAESIDLMESHLKRTGAEYEILKSIKF